MYKLHETKNCSVRPSASAHSLWGVKGQDTVIHRIREPIYPNQEGGKKGRKEKSKEARSAKLTFNAKRKESDGMG